MKAKTFSILGSSVTCVLVKLIHLILQSVLKFLGHHLPGYAIGEAQHTGSPGSAGVLSFAICRVLWRVIITGSGNNTEPSYRGDGVSLDFSHWVGKDDSAG